MVEESALVGAAHGCSEFVLRNGSSLRWNPIPGNQQGVAWECSLRLCRVLEERGRRYRRVLELVRLTFFLLVATWQCRAMFRHPPLANTPRLVVNLSCSRGVGWDFQG
jgi:hypothetical protein